MASDQHIPPPNRKASFSARSAQSILSSNLEDAPPTPSTGAHRHDTEFKETSPPIISHQKRHPSPQGTPRNAFNSPSNPADVSSNGASQPPKQEESRRFLGIPAYQGHSYIDRSYDYMRKYPSDAPGKELDPDARVWKVYLDESESYDNDMIKSFRDTIDSLLVFATLFSSVVTGFVGQTSQALEPDYAQIGVSLLFEQIEVLRAAGNATRIQEIPRSPLTPDSTTHSSRDVAINWLFFASLAFSLATAFIAILIKQWLQAFTALIPGDAKRRSLTRQFRFTGLQKWKLPEIVNVLPLFLHLALALFLVGLCLFVSQLHPSITAMVSVVTCAAIAFYVITGALPAVHLDCPYRLPILFIPACVMVYSVRMIRFKIAELLQSVRYDPDFEPNLPRRSLSPLHSQEQDHVSLELVIDKLQALSLAWLFDQTPNTSVQRVALHGVNRLFRSMSSTCENPYSFRIFLRDSLPWQAMSKTAIRLCTPEAQLEDGLLLRDLVLSSRRVCGPLYGVEAEHVLDSPYFRTFVERKVFTTFRPGALRVSLFDYALNKHKWDDVIYMWSSFGHFEDFRLDGYHALAFPSVSRSISHQDWVTVLSIAEEKGVNFNTFHLIEHSRSTLLHILSSYGTVPALQHLVSHVPALDLNVTDCVGSTPLHLACDRGNPDLKYELFLWQSRNFNSIMTNLKKPVPLVCYILIQPPVAPAQRDFLKVIEQLLSSGSDPNIVDHKGCLPLHITCSNGFQSFGCTEEGLKVIEQLLEATDNINQCSKDGFTPLDLLEKSDRKDTEEAKVGYSLMRKHGARLAKELTKVEKDKREDPSSRLL